MKKYLFLAILSVLIIELGFAADGNKIPLIGAVAPSFKTKTTNGDLNFPEDFGKSWKILFSHPQDFTPVCSSEILELGYLQNQFDELGVKVAVVSTDNVDRHKQWKAHLETIDYKGKGKVKINFPILEDNKHVVSIKYGMLHDNVSTTKAVRGVFIIDDKNVVRSVNFYPMEVGRNMDEIVRIIQALQTTSQAKVVTPANWKMGDDVMVPYFPYTADQLAANPALKDEFYLMGNQMWFKRGAN